jgi:hypothetical protein
VSTTKTNIDGKKNNSSKGDPFSIEYSRISVSRMRLTVSEDTTELQTVEINGVVFYKKGSIREIVKIAALKFTDEHFNKIDELIVGGYQTKAAEKRMRDKVFAVPAEQFFIITDFDFRF